MLGNHLWSSKSEEECNATGIGEYKSLNTWLPAKKVANSWRYVSAV